MSFRRALLLLAFALSGSTGVAQIAPSTSGLDITVSAKPAKALPGSMVTLSGQTGLVGAGSAVTILITPPGGKPPVPLKVTPKPSGEFTANFTATQAMGSYQVLATAPDGKGKAQTTFTVVSAGTVPADVGNAADALAAAVVKEVGQVRTGLNSLPASPARTEALNRLAPLETEAQKLPAQAKILRTEINKLYAARAKITAPVPAWDEFQAEIEAWPGEANTAVSSLSDSHPAGSAGSRQCAQIDDLVEDLTSVSEAMNIMQKPIDIVMGLTLDKVPAGGLSRGAPGLSPDQQFALTESVKAAGTILQGPAGVVNATLSYAIDVAGFIAKQAFDQFCVKFEGPLSGTFLGESFTKGGEPFFDYTVRLDGRLLLMYPKSASGPSIPLQGYLEGSGLFDVRDNPAPVQRLIPGTVLFHRVQSPPGFPYVAEVGRPSQRAMPSTFRIPVTGTLAGDSIVIALGSADHDFSDLIKGVSTWVVMPLGGLVPQIINSSIAIQKAHPILDRVIRLHPVLRVSQGGKTMVAEGTFQRDTTNATRTARVRTKVTLKACNPGCLPLLTPGQKLKKP
jgi:hypothetical protein